MAVKDRPPHDRALFKVLVSHMREVEPEVRAGAMFGAPAVFVGARGWRSASTAMRSGRSCRRPRRNG